MTVSPRKLAGPSALILAAGASSRFNGTKQLAKVQGKTLVESVIDAVPRAQVSEIVVVLGHRALAVRKSVPTRGVKFVTNPGFREGLASSIRVGISQVSADSDGVLLMLADQPFVTKTFVSRMLRVFESGSSPAKIVAAGYGDLMAPPVIFSRKYFRQLTELEGDQGARSVIASDSDALIVVKAPSKMMLADVDTRQQLEKVGGYPSLEKPGRR